MGPLMRERLKGRGNFPFDNKKGHIIMGSSANSFVLAVVGFGLSFLLIGVGLNLAARSDPVFCSGTSVEGPASRQPTRTIAACPPKVLRSQHIS